MPPPAPAPRVAGRSRPFFAGATLVLLAGTVALCVWAPEPGRVAAAGAEAAAVPVPALTVEPQSLERRARFSGVVEARRHVELVSETSGRVRRKGADEFDAVEADQLLIEVDPLLAEVAVERAAAAVARAESQLALARDERRRWESLATEDAASVSRRDQAVSSERVATANQREARANLAQARDELAKKTIRAPFAGVLQSFPLEEDETLRPGDPVAELLDLSLARIVIGVSDREVVGMRAGAQVAVSLEAWPGEDFTGTIVRVAAAADASLKFPVEIELPNPERRILPGMVARVSLTLADQQPLRVVPRDAVVESFGVPFVFVLSEAEGGALVAQRRSVELRELAFRPELFELVSGVADGERIAAGATQELRDGVRVRITRAEAAAPPEPAETGS